MPLKNNVFRVPSHRLRVDNHDSVPRRTSQHDSDPLTDPKLNWPSQLEGHHEGIYAYDLDILNNLGILVRALRHF